MNEEVICPYCEAPWEDQRAADVCPCLDEVDNIEIDELDDWNDNV